MQGSGPPRPVVGVSPAAGDKPQPYIRTALPPAAGDECRRYRGRRCRRPVGDECRRCRVPGLPRPVVGVSPAAGDKPQPYIRSAALPPAAGDERRPYRGRRCRRRCRGSGPPTSGGRCFAGGGGRAPAIQGAAVIVSLAVGDECRRCRVPALPRPVVGVSPAAGDKPQPYIRSAALPPAVQGSGPPTSGGRCFAGGGGQAPALH